MNRREFLLAKGYSDGGSLLRKPVFEGGPLFEEAKRLHAEYLEWIKGKNPDIEPEATVSDYTLQVIEPFDELSLVDPFGRVRTTIKINWE